VFRPPAKVYGIDLGVGAATAAWATRTPQVAHPTDVSGEDWAIEGYVYT
jgi:hypothetical protein